MSEGIVVDGKYKILGVLGTGGMAAVYRAEHIKIGRMVALKLLLPEFVAYPELVQRVEREARAAGGVDHANVVEIVDLGITPQYGPYIAMELLKGEDLATFAERRGGKLPPIEAAEISRQVLAALSAAHAKGVIHRDLKPENIFLVQDDDRVRVKVLDFGISKLAVESGKLSSLTRTGTVLGTPQFMAPEQAAGAREQDSRVDIYAAGVVLYALLTGQLPYEAENYNLLINDILNKPPKPILSKDPSLDARLAAAVMKSLARNPGDRFANAKEMQDALMVFLDAQTKGGGARVSTGITIGPRGAAERAPPNAPTLSLPNRAAPPAVASRKAPVDDEAVTFDQAMNRALDDEPTTSFDIPPERPDPPINTAAPAIGAPAPGAPAPGAPPAGDGDVMSLSQLVPIHDALKMAYAATDAQRAAKAAAQGAPPADPMAPLPSFRSNTRTPLGWENTPAGVMLPPRRRGRGVLVALLVVFAAAAGGGAATRAFSPVNWNIAVRAVGLGGLAVSDQSYDPEKFRPLPPADPPMHTGASNPSDSSEHHGTHHEPTGDGESHPNDSTTGEHGHVPSSHTNHGTQTTHGTHSTVRPGAHHPSSARHR